MNAPRGRPRGLHATAAGAALLIGASAVLIGTFLPWVRSGQVWRNSYAMWRSADRLGVVSSGPAQALMVLWFLLLVVMGGMLLALAFHHQRTAMVMAGAVAVLPAVAALLAWRSPLVVGAGVFVTLFGAMLVAVGIIEGWRSRSAPEPPREGA